MFSTARLLLSLYGVGCTVFSITYSFLLSSRADGTFVRRNPAPRNLRTTLVEANFLVAGHVSPVQKPNQLGFMRSNGQVTFHDPSCEAFSVLRKFFHKMGTESCGLRRVLCNVWLVRFNQGE